MEPKPRPEGNYVRCIPEGRGCFYGGGRMKGMPTLLPLPLHSAVSRLLPHAVLFVLLAMVSPVHAQDEDRPLYKTSYRVINVHRHCDTPSEEKLKAEMEVMDRVGVPVIVNLLMDGGWADANLPA